MALALKRAIDGNPAVAPPEGFDELYQRTWWPMLRLATALVDDVGSAEDVVQDAFAALYRRWDTLRDRAAAAGYVRTSIVNGSRSVLRRRGTSRKHLHLIEADSETLLREEHELVHAAMSRLPARQREVLVLRYVAELPDSDIAAATGLSESGVRSAASRALATLRTTLGGQL
jgi:RNA polymerase sigma-70 factor (sigma-E family)